MDEVAALLEAAAEPGSPNRTTAPRVRKWLSEYLAFRRTEVARFPKLAGRPHWDLIAADFDTELDAVFVLAFFSAGTVCMVAGRGECAQIRSYGESEFPDDPSTILDDVAARFWTAPTRVIMTMEELSQWLQL